MTYLLHAAWPGRTSFVRLQERARIVLLAADGLKNKDVAAELGIDANKVGRWRKRYAGAGLPGIEKERPRGGNHGGKDSRAQAKLRARVIEATTQATPKDATQWSCRSLARHLGTTHSFANRVWRSHGPKPHLIRTVQAEPGPAFRGEAAGRGGPVPGPAGERGGVQLRREEPDPGAGPDAARPADEEGALRDYDARHGTTSLFAALDMATGEVIGRTYRQHRHQEVVRFLREIDKAVPNDQEIHLVLDNYAMHKHEKVQNWIEGKKRVFLHFTPTSASWANMVERFFALLAEKQIRRGAFTSVPQLEKCLREYLKTYNEDPRPLVWTKSVAQIMEKVERGRKALAEASQSLFCCFVKDTTLVLAEFEGLGSNQRSMCRKAVAHLDEVLNREA